MKIKTNVKSGYWQYVWAEPRWIPDGEGYSGGSSGGIRGLSRDL